MTKNGKGGVPMKPDNSRQVAYSPFFGLLLQKKKHFLIPMCLIFLIFYFSLPVLITLKPDWMNRPVVGSITIAWVFAAAQCVMTLVLSSIYMWKAREFDRLVLELRNEESEEEK